MLFTLPLFLALQTVPASQSTPPSGDTASYWQQEIRYRIRARLDESRSVVVARAELMYINNSPDTLRELYLHQHLNAFRPGSAWSATDAREGRVRFQNLQDPDYAYERFTAAPRIRRTPAGSDLAPGTAQRDTWIVTPVLEEYPLAPDSSVVRFPLRHPLAPGDSLWVDMDWEARPSTLPRRQGRRGRHYDFAQWYPRVAVYDRLGWRSNPLVPAGEFYGEFGTYDVTLDVRDDQVLAATGVVVEGDPGWNGARRWGAPHMQPDAYDDVPPAPMPLDALEPGFKRVRFYAENVHHFAWSTSPDYRYEGGTYVRPRVMLEPPFPIWDTVAVHVLYQPGDEQSWGNGTVVGRTIQAAQWLESIFGPYAYPQISVLHRIEGGGTEFPMMQMNGSASLGLNLHEFGHVFIHGILANNEWASGWIDEGFSSYQSSWAQRFTAQDRTDPDAPRFGRPEGYRGRAVLPDPIEAGQIGEYELLLTGRAEPIGTLAHEFSEFGIYNQMIYGRGSTMFGQLRDLLGDRQFRTMLSALYRNWAFRHVDELAIRLEAERAHGSDLGWFFEQWVHRTGLIDYALREVDIARDGQQWVTRARVERIGSYRHPMPVGVRTSAGWTIERTNAAQDEQTVEIRTSAEPLEVRLDPERSTDDWDRRNDVAPSGVLGTLSLARRDTRVVFDWPFLEQVDRERQLIQLAPYLSYADGGLVGLHADENYQGWIDRLHVDLGVDLEEKTLGDPETLSDRLHVWVRLENPSWGPGVLDGLRIEAGAFDEIMHGSIEQRWDISRYLFTSTPVQALTLGASYTTPRDWSRAFRWSYETWEGRLRYDYRTSGASRSAVSATLAGGAARRRVGLAEWSNYPRIELSVDRLHMARAGRVALFGRAFFGLAEGAPYQRGIFVSSADPLSRLDSHWSRPGEMLLRDADDVFIVMGGGGLRGYSPFFAAERLMSTNLEAAFRLVSFAPRQPRLGIWASSFADGGYMWGGGGGAMLADAGVALSLRGQLFDREVRLRADFPIYVRHPGLDRGFGRGEDRVAFRWGFSFSDLW